MMRRGVVAGLLLMLTACGGSREPAGDAGRGQALFASAQLRPSSQSPSCLSCHSATPGEPPAVGPNLSNVGSRAARAVAGQSAAEYLRASIVDPDAYLAPGYQEGIHPRDYAQVLSRAQIADLVAYLLTLQSGQD